MLNKVNPSFMKGEIMYLSLVRESETERRTLGAKIQDQVRESMLMSQKSITNQLSF